jgi:AcrR family transcriptional regulator
MGLRERKKAQTRQTIQDAAFALFSERGFQATTVADIAAGADIAPRTFFAYFPSKEAVVFADLDDVFDELEMALRERPEGESTFEVLRAWTHDSIGSGGPEGDARAGVRHRLVCDNESIAAFERHVLGRFEKLIAAAVAIDLGDAETDLRPRLVAAAAVAALTAMRPDDPEEHAKPVGAEALAQLDEAFTFLRGGIAALQERRAAVTPN